MFEQLSRWKWSYHASDQYAIRLEKRGDKRVTIELHRFVLGPKGENAKIIDHINGNKLDCRRENLRPTDNLHNQRNRGKQKNNTSDFKGVSWDKAHGQYSAQIQHLGTLHFLGYFNTAEEAARAYDAEAKKLHGEFANLNFPGGGK